MKRHTMIRLNARLSTAETSATRRSRTGAEMMLVACLAMASLWAQPLAAQWRAPTLRASGDPTVIKADSLTAKGDTVQAVALLASAVVTQPTNAALWHRYGVLLWQGVASQRSGGFIRDGAVIRALQLADSALRLATQFDRDNPAYWVSLAEFNLQSDMGSMRFAAAQQMALAQKSAERVGDSVWLALAADEVGLATWRRRETTAHRALVGAGQRMQLQTDGRFNRGKAGDFLASFAHKIDPPTGQADLEAALTQFRLATAMAPTKLRYSRHLYMGLATDRRWDELLAIATTRARASDFDAQARFARGVALHRLRRNSAARAAFDTALTLLDDSTRAELFRLDRLLSPGSSATTGAGGMDVAAFRTLNASQREAMQRMYWALNDPVPATTENEAELEFIARVVQADWTWTEETLGLQGADSDRGDIFVRYGPPDKEMTMPGTASVSQDLSASKDVPDAPMPIGQESRGLKGGMTSTSQLGGTTLAWLYTSGDVFFFDLAPGFGTARIPLTDQRFVRDVASIKPVTFDNLGAPRLTGALSVRTTRFRGTADSADVVIVAMLPEVPHAGDESQAPKTIVDLLVIDGTARKVSHSSASQQLAANASTKRTWVERLGGGANFVRVDVTDVAASKLARAMVAVEVKTASDFGVSDVLLTQVGQASVPVATANRWSDLGVTPSGGTYGLRERVGLAWETYALGTDNAAGANRYRVAVVVSRTPRRGASALALRLLDGLGRLVAQERMRDDRVGITFDRTVSAKPVQVEYLTLDGLGDAPGEYTLAVTVTDLVTGRVATTNTVFSVRN